MKRSISAISNLKQNKNSHNTSRNKSPQRLVNGVKLFNFSDLDSYRHINRPYLNEVKKEHIKNKLDLEKSTETRVARRIKRNEMFISYARNPFVVTHRHSKSQTAIIADEPSLSNRTIIEEINNLKLKRLNREIESRELDEVQFHAHNMSALMQLQAKNTPHNLPFRKPKVNKSMVALEPKPKETQAQVQVQVEGEMEFDDILEMKDEKYADKREREMNIFQLLYDKDFFNRNLTTLDKYFFSFNSLLEKFQKFKIKIYRDISRESRVNVSKKPEGKSDRFQNFIPNELNFNDLINVAAGRYTPEIVYLQLNLDRANDAANNSEINEEEIVYGENTANMATAAENFNQSVKEVEEFLKLVLTKKEQNYHRVNLHRKEEIKRKMERVCDLVNNSVYDKKLHRELRNQISNDIAVFTGEDLTYPKPTHERDAVIRYRKENKNKKDMIKLQQLLDTFRIANQHDRQVKQLINKRI